MALAQLKPAKEKPDGEDICLFGQTNFRNQMRKFGIKTDDRRRHMYIIGKTGMGKSTMMENMILSDIYNGVGVGLVDPHGDFAEKVIDFIPPHRINDVVYFNPSDTQFPIGFNILEVKNEEQKHLVAGGLMGTFKKIWPDVWSSRMEYILGNTLLALLDNEGSTLLWINRMLGDKEFRKKVVANIKDPVVKGFWQGEFANYEDRYAKEAVAPIQNKIGQFLSASVIRNMVAQVKSTINIRDLMDSRKIVIMNLSKGRIGEDNSRLLGGMLITKIQLAAMERVDTPEAERQDFFLYVDEFQNFATPSFANILSEARKYRLSLIMAHQYIKQLDEVVADAVFGNVGTIVTFRVGGPDATMLVQEFTPTFTEDDIVNLPKFSIFLKLMIDGIASMPFSAGTLPPIAQRTGSLDKVVRASRERYAKRKEEIEEKVNRWSEEKEESRERQGSSGGGRGRGDGRSGGGRSSDRSRGGRSDHSSGSSRSDSSRSSSGSRSDRGSDRDRGRDRDRDRDRDQSRASRPPSSNDASSTVETHKPFKAQLEALKQAVDVPKSAAAAATALVTKPVNELTDHITEQPSSDSASRTVLHAPENTAPITPKTPTVISVPVAGAKPEQVVQPASTPATSSTRPVVDPSIPTGDAPAIPKRRRRRKRNRNSGDRSSTNASRPSSS